MSGWVIVGCLFGLLLSVGWVIKKVCFCTIFCVALLLIAASNVYLYFQYQTMGLFDNMILPTLLNYTGLLMLYSMVAAFGMKSLPSRHLATFVFLMIWMCNAIASVVGSSFYANRLNHRQQYYITRLAQTVNRENALAVTSLKGRITVQAAIVAMKEITGQTVWLLLGTVGMVLLLPYHKGETT